MNRTWWLPVLCAVVVPWPDTAAGQVADARCPRLGQDGAQYHDYLDPASQPTVALVERFHFSPNVENLVKGDSSAYLADDIAFVLNAVPNHYRALAAMGRWQARNPKVYRQLQDRLYSAECYFKRASQVREADPTLHTISGVYLHQTGALARADEEYARAEALGSDSAELFYNRGLLKLELGDLAAAQTYAEKAYARGYPLPGLRNKLAAAVAKSKTKPR